VVVRSSALRCLTRIRWRISRVFDRSDFPTTTLVYGCVRMTTHRKSSVFHQNATGCVPYRAGIAQSVRSLTRIAEAWFRIPLWKSQFKPDSHALFFASFLFSRFSRVGACVVIVLRLSPAGCVGGAFARPQPGRVAVGSIQASARSRLATRALSLRRRAHLPEELRRPLDQADPQVDRPHADALARGLRQWRLRRFQLRCWQLQVERPHGGRDERSRSGSE